MSLVLLVLQIIISILLIIMILLQRSDNDGLGLGSSGGSNFLSSRGQANLMTKITSILAVAFMANSLLLAAINARGGANSIADEIILEQSKQPDFQVPLDGVKVDGVKNENVPIEAPITEPNKVKPVQIEPAKIDEVKPDKVKNEKSQAPSESVEENNDAPAQLNDENATEEPVKIEPVTQKENATKNDVKVKQEKLKSE